jgi:hypothetical protein
MTEENRSETESDHRNEQKKYSDDAEFKESRIMSGMVSSQRKMLAAIEEELPGDCL